MDPSSRLDGFELLDTPGQVTRITAVARALRKELDTAAMVEVVTLGRMATRTAVPDIGPSEATPAARERLVASVRSRAATVVEEARDGGRGVAIGVPVVVGHTMVAVVCAWFSRPTATHDHAELVELAATGLAGWWERQEQLRAHESSRALDGGRARERERRRLAFDLHGSVAQELAAARISAETAEIISGEGGQSAELLATVRRHIEVAQAQTRRLINALGARSPDEETLTEIVEGLCREYEHKLNIRRRVQLSLSVSDLPPAASAHVCEAVAFVLREVLQNVYEHANATAVAVGAASRSDELSITVTDDGAGFDRRRADDGNLHLGLDGVRERIRAVGGSVAVTSNLGEGTRVVAAFPVTADVRTSRGDGQAALFPPNSAGQ